LNFRYPLRKRIIVIVTNGEDGTVERVTIPMRYAYAFVGAAIMGMFTIAGMAGSYTRMLAKAETINRLRDELAMSRKDYGNLEKKAHAKDVQAASLGSLATEVSAIYGLTARGLTTGGLTAGKLMLSHGHGAKSGSTAAEVAKAPLKDASTSFTDDSYYKSLDTFYALKNTASEGLGLQQNAIPNLAARTSLSGFTSMDAGDVENVPDMWPILGPINSGFGQREDPILGNGEGEFHKGVDIGSPEGTPVHVTADGRVVKAGINYGYGREIEIDHGNGVVTLYGHLHGFNVVEGQTVAKGEVIGFVGHSGRTTGNHLHYEVQIRGAAVNPHKYLRTTMADIGGGATSAQ
jgi:murein DD-endopeptidase MepM/ murein hydrolase activator NlpD